MFPSTRFSRRGLAVAGACAGAVVAHVGVAVFFASHDPYSTTVFPPCPILALTGMQCPGCGGTRALYSLFHGDVAGSFAMNPLVLASYAAGALLVGSLAATSVGRQRLSKLLSSGAIAAVGVAGLYVTLIRNLLP